MRYEPGAIHRATVLGDSSWSHVSHILILEVKQTQEITFVMGILGTEREVTLSEYKFNVQGELDGDFIRNVHVTSNIPVSVRGENYTIHILENVGAYDGEHSGMELSRLTRLAAMDLQRVSWRKKVAERLENQGWSSQGMWLVHDEQYMKEALGKNGAKWVGRNPHGDSVVYDPKSSYTISFGPDVPGEVVARVCELVASADAS